MIYSVSKIASPIMSLFALTICLVAWAGIVRDPPGDEGALAHSFQLLVLCQLPIMAYCVFIALRRGWRREFPMLASNLALWISAIAIALMLGL